MKKRNMLFGLSMVAFTGIALASCGSENLTETQFSLTEPKMNDGVNVYNENDYTLKSKYSQLFETDDSHNPYKEELAPYKEKFNKFRDSIITDYESYTLTSYKLDKDTNRITYEKAILDFKTFNVFYYLNSYIEKDGKKENSINLVTKAYRKDNQYTVVSDVSLDSFLAYTGNVDEFGIYEEYKVSGNGKFYTKFNSPNKPSNYNEYAVTDDFTWYLMKTQITKISPILLNDADSFALSDDYSYAYFESNEYYNEKVEIEDYMIKSYYRESDLEKCIRNFSLNKKKAFENDLEPKLDGYKEYSFEPIANGYENILRLPLAASSFQTQYMFNESNPSYLDLFNNSFLLNEFEFEKI